MSSPRPETDPGPTGMRHGPGHEGRVKHGGHGRMLMLMCVPPLIVAFLVFTGAAGTGAFVPALICVAMMFMMPGGHSHT